MEKMSGVPLSLLATFMNSDRLLKSFPQLQIGKPKWNERDFRDETTEYICENYVKPLTKQKQCSVCELLGINARPSVFISHAWKYYYKDVVSILEKHFKDQDPIIWFDLFSNNQHLNSSRNPDWWLKTFEKEILAMQRTVLVFAPWKDEKTEQIQSSWRNPLTLKRAWCLSEIFFTLHHKVRLEIAFPREIEYFIRSLYVGGQNAIEQPRVNVNSKESQCGKKGDREAIFEVIKPIGFSVIDRTIISKIHEILIQTLIDFIDSPTDYSRKTATLREQMTLQIELVVLLADIYLYLGNYKSAIEVLENILQLKPYVFDKSINIYSSLASAYRMSGNCIKAEECAQKALTMSKLDFHQNMKVFYPKLNIKITNESIVPIQQLHAAKDEIEREIENYNAVDLSNAIYNGWIWLSLGSKEGIMKGLIAAADLINCPVQRRMEIKHFVKNNDGLLFKIFNLKRLLATIFIKSGNNSLIDEAESLIFDCIDFFKKNSVRKVWLHSCLATLALVLDLKGRKKESEELYVKCLDYFKITLGENHSTVLQIQCNFADLKRDDVQYKELIEQLNHKLPANHPILLQATNNRAWVLQSNGQCPQAIELMTNCLTSMQDKNDSILEANEFCIGR